MSICTCFVIGSAVVQKASLLLWRSHRSWIGAKMMCMTAQNTGVGCMYICIYLLLTTHWTRMSALLAHWGVILQNPEAVDRGWRTAACKACKTLAVRGGQGILQSSVVYYECITFHSQELYVRVVWLSKDSQSLALMQTGKWRPQH